MNNLILSTSFPIWLYYPSLIKWKIQQRNLLDKTEISYLISTINASLINDMATFWEGIVFEMQSEIFYTRFDKNKGKFQKSLSNYFDSKLGNATWINYLEYFDLLLGEKLVARIECENWKTVNIMFSYRNMLVHGKEIEMHYFKDEGGLYAESPYGFKKIFDFLKEKNLLDFSFSPNLNSVDMLNDNIVDFFYVNMIEFIERLFQIFPDSEVSELKHNFTDCLTY